MFLTCKTLLFSSTICCKKEHTTIQRGEELTFSPEEVAAILELSQSEKEIAKEAIESALPVDFSDIPDLQ